MNIFIIYRSETYIKSNLIDVLNKCIEFLKYLTQKKDLG